MGLTARAICERSPVIPVLTIEDAGIAAPLTRALAAGGLPVVEVTLRTPAALDALRAAANAVPGAIVGAGSVVDAGQVAAVRDAGGAFCVSPGATRAVIDAAAACGLALLPGAQTPSEVMRLLEAGLEVMKFFPAEAAGGPQALRALAAPLPRAAFCPTGGITAANARAYLELENVLCVGGSWVAPPAAVAAGDWARIERLAAGAAALRA